MDKRNFFPSRETATRFAQAVANGETHIVWREWLPYYPIGRNWAHYSECVFGATVGAAFYRLPHSQSKKQGLVLVLLWLLFVSTCLSVWFWQMFPLVLGIIVYAYYLLMGNNREVCADLTAQTFYLQGKHDSETIAITPNCCLAYDCLPSGWHRNSWVVLKLYHGQGECTQLFSLAAAPPFGRAEADILRDTEAFAHYLADSMNIRLISEYRDKV